MAHPMIESLNEELAWTNEMYLASGKSLGVTVFDVSKKNREFKEEVEEANRMNLEGGVTTSLITTSGSDISFNKNARKSPTSISGGMNSA